MQSDLKWDTQIKNVTCKANRILGMIRKSFRYPTLETIKLLYCSLVRPHLEFAICSWCPYFEKDIYEIEKIQHRATKLIPNLRNLEYEQRLSILGLTNLKTKRIRRDLIQMYKLINKMELVNFKNGINFSRNKKLEDKGYNLR